MRRTAVLVDTGLFGTTQDLLAAALPDLNVACVLIARSFRPGGAAPGARTTGLSVEAADYSPLHPPHGAPPVLALRRVAVRAELRPAIVIWIEKTYHRRRR